MHRRQKGSNEGRSIILHPFLLAAYPVLFLFAQNRDEGVFLGEVWAPLGLAVGSATVVFILGWVMLRNARAVALVVSAWTLLFFSYGRVAEALSDITIAGVSLGEDRPLLWIWAALGIGVVIAAYKLRTQLSGVTTALNVIAVVLVGFNVVTVAMAQPMEVEAGRSATDVAERPSRSLSPRKHLPDIYYIVPDYYGAPLFHREWFGVDSQWLNRYLKRKGFYVAWKTMANYQNTRWSLASSLNMEYLDSLFGGTPTIEQILEKLQNYEVARYLKSLGYRHVHLGSWYRGTDFAPSADINLSYEGFSEFSSTLYQTTVLPPIFRTFGIAEEELDPRRAKWKRALAEFDLVARARHIPGPKFVFAHILFPHVQGPKPGEHTVDRNGNFVTREQEKSRSYQRLYGDQVVFAAKRLKQLIDTLLADPDYRPVIVLQTDEGPYANEKLEDSPVLFDYKTAPKDHLRGKYMILNAYYFPGVPHNRLYPSITPVNSFRLLFNLYFNAKFPLLSDRHFARRPEGTRIVDITKLIRRLLESAPLEPP